MWGQVEDPISLVALEARTGLKVQYQDDAAEKLERAEMTRSLVALVAALGCFGAELAADPLLSVRRIYIAECDGTASAQIRDMLINALQSSKLFAVTEKEEKADAVLRGSAEPSSPTRFSRAKACKREVRDEAAAARERHRAGSRVRPFRWANRNRRALPSGEA